MLVVFSPTSVLIHIFGGNGCAIIKDAKRKVKNNDKRQNIIERNTFRNSREPALSIILNSALTSTLSAEVSSKWRLIINENS